MKGPIYKHVPLFLTQWVFVMHLACLSHLMTIILCIFFQKCLDMLWYNGQKSLLWVELCISHVILFQDALTLWAPIIALCYSWYFRWHCKGTFYLWELGQFVKQWWKCCHRLWHMCWIKVMIINLLDIFCKSLYPHVVALWWAFPPNCSWKGMHLNKIMVLLLKRLKVENLKIKIHAYIFLCIYILSGI